MDIDSNSDSNYSKSAYGATTDSESTKEKQSRLHTKSKSKSKQGGCDKEKDAKRDMEKKHTCSHRKKVHCINIHCLPLEKCMVEQELQRILLHIHL